MKRIFPGSVTIWTDTLGKNPGNTPSDGEDLLLRETGTFDLLFLDVEMRWSNGVDVARSIREKDSDLVILFVSRIARYAVEGYSVDALDYLLKPVGYEELAVKLRRALRHIDSHRAFRIRLSQGGDYRWVSTDAIRFVEVFGHHLVYHTGEGQFRTTDTIGAAIEQLGPYGFLQCSRRRRTGCRCARPCRREAFSCCRC